MENKNEQSIEEILFNEISKLKTAVEYIEKAKTSIEKYEKYDSRFQEYISEINSSRIHNNGTVNLISKFEKKQNDLIVECKVLKKSNDEFKSQIEILHKTIKNIKKNNLIINIFSFIISISAILFSFILLYNLDEYFRNFILKYSSEFIKIIL